ncbi:uncharacterized protein LLCC_1696 [Lactococcus cremoris]|uniref:Uncharacterized protein n=1 Tax=Lactococcus lactis subsp. cremoris TaxID=1359 RepID=A0AAD1JY61_LACLC|nr:hypothetical protein [Lactococcus cremoris]BBC76072.1 uncharacterized protein LLCC_1696 [Lactococcus cremoris]BCO02190.1 hypothetical protein LLG32_02840 [Lactococcus cremoris]BCO05148.1 hypothetical protein LLC_03880 [Lactococcus cremoris]
MSELEHEVGILRAENLKLRNEIARLSQQTQHSQPQLTIPKSIADALDKVPFHNPITQLSNEDCDLTEFNDTVKRYAWNNKENGYICIAYLAGRALGVDLVKVVEG